jgi:hypothetical protein
MILILVHLVYLDFLSSQLEAFDESYLEVARGD